MQNSSDPPWKEEEFENWFEQNSMINGEKLLVVKFQDPLRRDVDILALDSKGYLVLLEVKNEPCKRKALGQVLEYLSKYDAITLEGLGDECGKSSDKIRSEFRSFFGADLVEIGKGRRVYIVAPSFDSHSAVCLRFLTKKMVGAEIKFGFVVARRSGENFEISEKQCQEFKYTRDLDGQFAQTPTGWLFYVLKGGAKPILWRIGRRSGDDGQIRFISSATVNKHALRFSSRLLLPESEVPKFVDVSDRGLAMCQEGEHGEWAKVIGRLRSGDDVEQVVFARFRRGKFAHFQQKSADEFRRYFTQKVEPMWSWNEIVAASDEIQSERALGD